MLPDDRKPLVIDKCTAELWEGLRCVLPAGHRGSHQRPATDTTCEITWRSPATPPPIPPRKSAQKFRMITVTR